ncbi:uncharacterized protein LOC128987917 isoform X2 [Macrosteles quadrilineatus]|uniref:uncharacterized protein LOC128987917 isoform X2 n=1 Tax=Macrosteles quadrilineatus TaxID=74068 RepID=UPI0023E26703|nr:uncharacterized protein LOC128987917 isoform X2 [Macrosteles quadrilineatus]
MLHKKSEYRQQYNKLSEDLRRKIWLDNVALRKSRQLSNQATHYWEYQLRDYPCECEAVNETDSDGGPVPHHRQKHKELWEKYNHQLGRAPETKDARDEAVQTPEWTGDEPDRSGDQAHEEGVAGLGLPEGKGRRRHPATPTSVARTARSLSRPSRTTKNLATEPKQAHFVPYGWNEKTQKVGQKLTYNVHDSALHASQRRKAEVNEFLVQERAVKHHSRTPRERVCSNSSSLWMSEYQEQFSARSRQPRPASAPPAPRPPITWRHS